jgi:hypothetical protein
VAAAAAAAPAAGAAAAAGGAYRGVIDAFVKIGQQEGLQGYYKGFGPSLVLVGILLVWSLPSLWKISLTTRHTFKGV